MTDSQYVTVHCTQSQLHPPSLPVSCTSFWHHTLTFHSIDQHSSVLPSFFTFGTVRLLPHSQAMSAYSWTTPIVGPGDHRPTAQHIIETEGLVGKLTDKVILLTGASSGIGVETARSLYHTGAHLYLPVRDMAKGEAVKADIESDGMAGRGTIDLLTLDMESLDSVRQCAADFLSKSSQLNILICNAGVAGMPLGTTKDGFESNFGINHLAHFLLFQLLKDALLASCHPPESNSRVVMVTSGAHMICTVELDDLHFTKRGYSTRLGYGQSKTANVHMALEIERRYGSRGLHSTSVHPGIIPTRLTRNLTPEQLKKVVQDEKLDVHYKNAQQGAATTVWAAVGRDWEGKGGKYLEDCMVAEKEENLPLGHRGYGAHAYDEQQAKELWVESLRMVGVSDDQ